MFSSRFGMLLAEMTKESQVVSVWPTIRSEHRGSPKEHLYMLSPRGWRRALFLERLNRAKRDDWVHRGSKLCGKRRCEKRRDHHNKGTGEVDYRVRCADLEEQ